MTRVPSALLLVLLLAPPAAAGALSDLLMAPGLFTEAADGPLLAYDEARTVPPGSPMEPLAEGRIVLAMVGAAADRRLELARQGTGGTTRPFAEFPSGGANPVLLYFLESAVRDLAAATGGNPFYLRNRMREALVAAGLGPDASPREIAIQPFVADRNRARLGPFADLTLRLRFDAADPGRLLELSADTARDADGYHHRLTLVAED